MTGRMSLDVSEILIKFGNLARLFELFVCAMLDTVSMVASSLTEGTFLRLLQCLYQELGPRGAKVTNTETLSLEYEMSEYARISSGFTGI